MLLGEVAKAAILHFTSIFCSIVIATLHHAFESMMIERLLIPGACMSPMHNSCSWGGNYYPDRMCTLSFDVRSRVAEIQNMPDVGGRVDFKEPAQAVQALSKAHSASCKAGGEVEARDQ
jgi:hypothetical protein